MILKKLNQYMGIVAILLTVYCLWNVSDTRYRLEVVTHNLEDLQRKVHIMHGADLLEAKERRDRREANMMEPPKWSGSKEKILHVEDFYSSKNSKVTQIFLQIFYKPKVKNKCLIYFHLEIIYISRCIPSLKK